MAGSQRRARQPNEPLARLITAAGASHISLAAQINKIAAAAGVVTRYEKTSVANWVNLGMIPRGRAPEFVAAALQQRLGRPVSLEEIGMYRRERGDGDMGLDFARDPADAVDVAATYWRTVDRRKLITTGFAVSAYATPVMRWMTTPADPAVTHQGGQRVGRGDVEDLWQAAEEARLWDSRYGGGNGKANSVTECLKLKAAPLLTGTYTETVGKELFTATAELSRVVGWSAFDMGQHELAQRHFVQALRLARAAGDVQTGCYVLTTMSLQTFLRGFPREAADMAEGAYERAKGHAAPRVLAFAKLAQARAHAREGDARAAGAALALSESLLDSIGPHTQDPEWLAYFTHARLATDATEIYRDLANPKAALTWARQADAMPAGRFTRAVGIRLAVLATSHLQARDLTQGLQLGSQALQVLRKVHSSRAHGYVRDITTALGPWRTEPQVADFTDQARTALAATV